MFQVNRELCIACQQCIKDCPVINLVDRKAEIHNDWGCIKCGHCLAICPVCAIFAIAVQDNPKLKEYLGLADKSPLISCLVIGYPDIKYQRTVPRKKPEIRWM